MEQGIKDKEEGRAEEAEEHFVIASLVLQTLLVDAHDHPERLGVLQYRRQLSRCHQHLAQMYQATGRDQEAKVSYEKALKLDPNCWGRFLLADLLLTSRHPEVRNPPLALQYAAKAFQDDNPNALALGIFGRAYYQTGQYVAAVEVLEKATGPNGGWVRSSNGFLLAMAHWQLGHKQEALE